MKNNKKEYTKWIIAFSLIAIVFNPLVQIYLYKQELCLPVDGIAALVFAGYAIKKYRKTE